MSLRSSTYIAITSSATLNSLFNAGRNLVNPLFIAIVSYLFIYRGLAGDLEIVNKVTAMFNLVLVFSGWGLRDYLLKESSKNYAEFNQNWHKACYSKFILLPILLIFCFICFPREYWVFISLVSLCRTFSTLYEPMIIVEKKNFLFLSLDLLSAAFIIVLIQSGLISNYSSFFGFLLVSEFVKLFFKSLVFKKPGFYKIAPRELLNFLLETKYYFLIVLASFFQSRVDLYLLGFFFSEDRLNEYQLLLSLVSLSQIVVGSIVSAYAKLFFRDISLSAKRFRKILVFSGILVAVISGPLIFYILRAVYGFDFNWYGIFVVGANILVFTWVLYEMFCYTKLDWLNRILALVFISGIVNLGFCLWLIPAFGVTGALGANTLSQVALAVAMSGGKVILRKQKSI